MTGRSSVNGKRDRALLVVWPEEQLVAIAANAMVRFDLPAAYALAKVAREGRRYR
ncbi:MAG: hypothetical protein ABIS00_14620 [Gemmatimonadales bacterium]